MNRKYITFGVGSENRTRIISLEGWNSTIKLYPHILLDGIPTPTN
jgi:hypothetical protein